MKKLTVLLFLIALLAIAVIPVKAGDIPIPVADEFGYYLDTSLSGRPSWIESISVEEWGGRIDTILQGNDCACHGYDITWIGDHIVTGKNYGNVRSAWVTIAVETKAYIPFIGGQKP